MKPDPTRARLLAEIAEFMKTPTPEERVEFISEARGIYHIYISGGCGYEDPEHRCPCENDD
jgi:hypothetical protein